MTGGALRPIRSTRLLLQGIAITGDIAVVCRSSLVLREGRKAALSVNA